MSWIHGARARLQLLFAGRAAESRARSEIAFHIEMESERLVREHGLPPDEARRRALATFGGATQHAESLRDGRGLAWLGGLSLDAKLAIRMLVKNPALSLVAVVGMSVAVAIGAVSFSAIHAVLGSSLPLSEGDRIVGIRNVDTRDGDAGRGTQPRDLRTWRDGLRAVEEIGAYRRIDRNLLTPDDKRSESARISEMTASGFRIARVPPLMGRYFGDSDEAPGAGFVAVIGYDLWQTRFAARPDIIGRVLQLGESRYTVIGVMPKGFAFPVNDRVWVPLKLATVDFSQREAPRLEVFARLARGASIADAQRQLSTIADRLALDDSATYGHTRPRVISYANTFIDSPETAWALHLAEVLVSLLLVVIGTNVAILVYARTASRLGEISLRTALGASRGRVVAQLFAEALALSSLSAAVGLLVAYLTLDRIEGVVANLAGGQIPFWIRFHLSPAVFAYAVGMAVLGAAIVGVVPALKATRHDVRSNLQRLSAGGSGFRLGPTWTFLVITQVAVAVAVLPVAIAGIAAWNRIASAQSAVASKEILTASLVVDSPGAGQYQGAGSSPLRTDFMDRLLGDGRVSAVAFASNAPGAEASTRVDVDRGGDAVSRADGMTATASHGSVVGSSRIDPAYFAVFGVPVLSGRAFHSGDVSGANVVIVNQSFVTKVLHGANPLGRRIRATASPAAGSAADAAPAWEQIVGVVPDFPVDSSTPSPKVYRPLSLTGAGQVTIAAKIRGMAAAAYIPRMRELAIETSPMLRLEKTEPFDRTLDDQNAARRLTILALELVTLSAVLLSAAGIYALMSFTVTRRRREIGIRSALGAGAQRLLASLLSRVFAQVLVGIAVGIAFATFVDQLLAGGWTGRRGVVVLPGVAALMAVIAVVAAIAPAARALAIQPTEAMRSE